MAESRGPSCDSDQDGIPCAPVLLPLPALQPQHLTPDPQMLLTPEREGLGRTGSGILRRHPPGKVPRRQVRFRLGSKSEDLWEKRPELPRPRVEETQTKSTGLPVPLPRKLGPSRDAAEEQPSPSMLAAPAPNSTLALRAEVQAVREQEFNARRAAQELVQRSFVTRCAVEARVVEGMNVPRDQQLFQDLVSLKVPEEELLSCAVQEKLMPLRPRPENRKELPCAGPDPMAFYDPEELFTEKACLEVGGLPPLQLQPQRRDPSTTFCMYRKLRQWDT